MKTDGSTLAAPPPAVNAFEGLEATMGSIFWAPSRAFQTLRVKNWWVVAFFLCLVTSILFQFSAAQYRAQDLKHDLTTDASISSEEAARRLANIDRQATTGGLAGIVLATTPFMAAGLAAKMLGMALAVWVALQLFSSRASYMTTLNVCSFIFLTIVPEAVLRGILVQVQETSRVFLGPAALLPSDWYRTPIFHMLDRMDIVTIWMAVLLAIALPIIAGVSRMKSALIVGCLWITWILVGAEAGNWIRIF